jgi:uncharacterized membrane protein
MRFLLIIHLFSVAAMVGATLVNGVLHARARSLRPAHAAPLLGGILAVNRWIMAPSLVLIPASGLGLAWAMGFALTASWMRWGIGLAVALVLAFLVGLRSERQLEVLADAAARAGQESLPVRYQRTFLGAAPIGFGALALSLAAIAVMVLKPM